MEYIANKPSNGKRGSFTLEITTSGLCDLSCTYCFEGEKTDTKRLNSDFDLIIKRIDSVLADDTWFNKHYTSLNLSFWGGEPTLNPKLIIDVMNQYKDDSRVDFHIYTNAFNMNNLNKIIENVDGSKLRIQVSYDGKLINDKYRLTKNKQITSNQVLNNLFTLAQKGVNVSMKSTLPIDNMETMYTTWLEFRDIQNMLWKVNKNIEINYAPTIDYVTKFTNDQKSEAIGLFRNEFLKIAKEEIKFYEEHGRYLCSWFGGEDKRSHCSAGYNMAAIDTDGSLYACHGALYSTKKTELKSTSIHDDDFIGKLERYTAQFDKPIKEIAKTCKECVATTCMICPVVSHEKSQKEGFIEQWQDNWVNELCGFFKTFGEIDRAVQAYFSKQREQKKIDTHISLKEMIKNVSDEEASTSQGQGV